MNAAVGCRTTEAALHVTGQLAKLKGPVGEWSDARVDRLLVTVTALVGEMAPKTVTEALLAAQMIGAQDAAMEFLHRARSPDQMVEMVDRNVARATRLMRIIDQCDAMAKLKGVSGQQRVIVEHVTVNGGGQAIVGAVTGGRGA